MHKFVSLILFFSFLPVWWTLCQSADFKTHQGLLAPSYALIDREKEFQALVESRKILESIARHGILSSFDLVEKGIAIHGSEDHGFDPKVAKLSKSFTVNLIIKGNKYSNDQIIERALYDPAFGSLQVMMERAHDFGAYIIVELRDDYERTNFNLLKNITLTKGPIPEETPSKISESHA